MVLERVALLETKMRARTKREVTFIVMSCVRKIVFLILYLKTLPFYLKPNSCGDLIKRQVWTQSETF